MAYASADHARETEAHQEIGVTTQASLFPDITVGSRWSVHQPKGVEPTVYELVREEPEHDPCYRFVLRLVAVDQKWSKAHELGSEMRVEAAWFSVRGALGAKSDGAVRRSA